MNYGSAAPRKRVPTTIATRICVVSWKRNDCATWTQQKGGTYRVLPITQEMIQAAEILRFWYHHRPSRGSDLVFGRLMGHRG